MATQRTWQRVILLAVLGYEGLGALVGGALLIARPDGRYMDMPVGIMHGTFRDFLIPGIILFGLGLLNIGVVLVWMIVLALALLRRGHTSTAPAHLRRSHQAA